MAKKKKSFMKKIGSLLLFLLINIIVFNASMIFDYSRRAVGLAELNWNEVGKIDIDMDNVLGNRAQVFSFNGNIIVNFASELHLYNIDGKLQVKKEINSDTTKLVGMDEAFLVTDFVQGNITVIDYLGKFTGKKEGLGNIDEVVSMNDNMFAIIMRSGDLKVFDMYGEEISSVPLPDGEFLSVDFSKSEELILVILLTSDEYNYNSKLITYSKNSMIGGSNNNDSIIYRAKIFDENVLVVDYKGAHVYRLNDASNEFLWEYEREGNLVTFDIDQNGNLIEIVNKSEVESLLDDFHLIGMNKDGVLLYDVPLDNKYEHISLGYGKILIHNNNVIYVYNSNGELVANRIMSKSIYNISWLSGTRLLIEYNDLVEILDLAY